MRRLMFLSGLTLLLTACGGGQITDGPKIELIGISIGDLETATEELLLEDRFESTDQNLVAIISFNNVKDGTDVMASWFNPDERTRPFGRKVITTENGSTVVRFSINNTEPWGKGPYMLHVVATEGEGEGAVSDEGRIRYYVDMTDEEIQAYLDEYAAWEAAQEAPEETHEAAAEVAEPDTMEEEEPTEEEELSDQDEDDSNEAGIEDEL